MDEMGQFSDPSLSDNPASAQPCRKQMWLPFYSPVSVRTFKYYINKCPAGLTCRNERDILNTYRKENCAFDRNRFYMH